MRTNHYTTAPALKGLGIVFKSGRIIISISINRAEGGEVDEMCEWSP